MSTNEYGMQPRRLNVLNITIDFFSNELPLFLSYGVGKPYSNIRMRENQNNILFIDESPIGSLKKEEEILP